MLKLDNAKNSKFLVIQEVERANQQVVKRKLRESRDSKVPREGNRLLLEWMNINLKSTKDKTMKVKTHVKAGQREGSLSNRPQRYSMGAEWD